MGFSEVFAKLNFFLNVRKTIKKEVIKRKPKFAILVDYQSFNFSLLSFLKKNEIKVFYFVAPQVWAWKSYRAKKISSETEVIYSLLPF